MFQYEKLINLEHYSHYFETLKNCTVSPSFLIQFSCNYTQETIICKRYMILKVSDDEGFGLRSN